MRGGAPACPCEIPQKDTRAFQLQAADAVKSSMDIEPDLFEATDVTHILAIRQALESSRITPEMLENAFRERALIAPYAPARATPSLDAGLSPSPRRS